MINTNNILADMPRGVGVVDKNQEFIYMNAEFQRSFAKFPKKKTGNLTLQSVFGSLFWKNTHKHFEAIFTSQDQIEIPIFNAEDITTKLRPGIWLSLFAVHHNNKNYVGILLKDANLQIQAERSLGEYKERLDQAQKAGKMGVFEWILRNNQEKL